MTSRSDAGARPGIRLDPCKHCGGAPEIVRAQDRDDLARVRCSSCGITTPYLRAAARGGRRDLGLLEDRWNSAAAPASAASAVVERVPSEDPLMSRWRWSCCGYEFSEPLCVPGYEPVAKSHCPKCGTRSRRTG